MEILFENKFVRTDKLMKELYQYYHLKRPKKIFSFILSVFLIVYSLINAILWKDNFYLFFAVLALAIFILEIAIYFITVKTQQKRDNEIMNGKPIEIQVTVTQDYIKNSASNGAENEISFSKIKSVFQTKNLILLMSEAKLIYIFPKDCFTVGNAEEFMLFLKNKGFNVK